MEGEEPLTEFVAFFGARSVRFLENRDAGALGKASHGAGEVEVFVVHDEAKDRATGPAAKAMEGLALGIDGEGGGLLAMKRAERLEAGSGPFEREVGTDNLNDVVGLGDPLDSFFSDKWHRIKLPCGSLRGE